LTEYTPIALLVVLRTISLPFGALHKPPDLNIVEPSSIHVAEIYRKSHRVWATTWSSIRQSDTLRNCVDASPLASPPHRLGLFDSHERLALT
jgi:hypothetical protein